MLYIFTKSTADAGGSRQRAFNVATFLHQAGYESQLVVPPIYRTDVSRSQARKEYLKTVFSLRKNDVVLLQNPIFNKYFIFLMCLIKVIFKPTFIFDFDDATWVQNPIAPKLFAFFSDKIIVASHYLLNWSYIKNKPKVLIPNLVNIETAQKYSHNYASESDTKIVLGWIGGAPDSMNNLQILIPVFKKLAEEKVPCTFRLVGALGDQNVKNTFISTGIECEFIDKLAWAQEGEIQKANASFDIGLCPLEDNLSNQARCSLKVLDYMAAKIPVIISPIGENNYFISDGIEGFLPHSEQEWVEKIKLLVSNFALRKSIGEKAQEKIRKEYSYQENIQKYIEFLGLEP